MQNKNIINILAISGIVLLLVAFCFDYKCIFKSIFNLPCISCGLTRGFKYILNGDFINATYMNLLSIPLFIMVILFYILYFICIILKKDYIFIFYNYFVKHYKLVIFIFLINFLIGILKSYV